MTDFFEVDAFRRAADALGTERSAAELTRLGYGCAEDQPANLQSLLNLAQRTSMAFAIPAPFAEGVHIFCASLESGGEVLNAAGRGTSRRRAFERCMGEIAELRSLHANAVPVAHLTFRDFEAAMGSDEARWAFELVGLDVDAERVAAVEAKTFPGGESVPVPLELVYRLPVADRAGRRPASSTGLGAGQDQEAAFESAFFEVIERDALGLWWHGGRPSRRIETEGLPISSFADQMSRRPERPWWALDVTTDLGIPAVAVASGQGDGTALVLGAAAAATMQDALERAFLEMCQLEFAQFLALARLGKDPSATPKGKDKEWLERYRTLNLRNFPEICPDRPEEPQTRPKKSLAQFSEMLAAKGFSVLRVDLTCADTDIAVSRCIIPRLQPKEAEFVSERLQTVRKQVHEKGIETKSKPEIL